MRALIVLVVLLLLPLSLNAATVNTNAFFPGPISISGRTNQLTDTGTTLAYNGNPINGGGATNLTPWTSDINGNSHQLTNASGIKTGTLADTQGTLLANLTNTLFYGLNSGTSGSPDTGVGGVATPLLNFSHASKMNNGGFTSAADYFFGSTKVGASTAGNGDIHNLYTIFAASQNLAGTGITDGTTNESIAVIGWAKDTTNTVGRIYGLIGAGFARSPTDQAIGAELDMDNGIGGTAQDVVNGISFPGALVGLNFRATSTPNNGVNLHSSAAQLIQATSQNESWLHGIVFLTNSVADNGSLIAFPALDTNVNLAWGRQMKIKNDGQLAIGLTNLALTSGGRGIHIKTTDGTPVELKLEATGASMASPAIVELYGETPGNVVVRNRIAVSGSSAIGIVGTQTPHDEVFFWNAGEVFRYNTNTLVMLGTNGITLGGVTMTNWPAGGSGGNWVASGTTNSSLAGTAFANNAVFTNGVNVGGSGASVFTNGIQALNLTATRVVVTDGSKNLASATATTSLIDGTGAAGTLAEWTNTAGIFNGNAAQFVGGDGAMHAQSGGGGGGGTAIITGAFGSVNPASGTPRYWPLTGGAGGSANLTTIYSPLPACTLTNLYVSFSGASSGTNMTFTVFTNGVASALTVVVVSDGSANNSGQDTTHSVAVPAGTKVSMELKTNASSLGAGVDAMWGVQSL